MSPLEMYPDHGPQPSSTGREFRVGEDILVGSIVPNDKPILDMIGVPRPDGSLYFQVFQVIEPLPSGARLLDEMRNGGIRRS